MRCAPVILLMVHLPMVSLWGQTAGTGEFPAPPVGYQILRFDENYFSLANPSNRTDFFDPIKYIPLRANEPSWYLTFGGEVRERFEGKSRA